jgi:hypothetical protein
LNANLFAENGLADVFPHYKRPDGTDVYDIELLQLLCERRRATEIRPADVHSTKKDNPLHVEV